jgi:hypothetical protein
MSIIDPYTTLRYSLKCNKGKSVLKSYIQQYQCGGVNTLYETDTIFKSHKAGLDVTSVEFLASADIRKFQKKFSKNETFKSFDKLWGERMNLVIDFMGNYAVWKFLLNDDIDIYERKPPRKSTIVKSDRHQAYFTGHHWLSIVKNTRELFDPYSEYQITGTNQFCQTYALMHLMNKLPGQSNQVCSPFPYNSFKKYYYYTRCALDFIVDVIKSVKKAELKLYDYGNTKYIDNVLKWAFVLRRNSNVTLNIIGMPFI